VAVRGCSQKEFGSSIAFASQRVMNSMAIRGRANSACDGTPLRNSAER